jgi:hypothetical protein
MRSLKQPAICLQVRDLALLTSLFESRAMTAVQAAAICFDGHKEAAKKAAPKTQGGEVDRRARASAI